MASDLDPVVALLGEKWFWPILLRLDDLEGDLVEILPLLEPVLRDESPDWTFNCVLDVANTDSAVNGFCDPRKIDGRSIGRMVGAKVALCEGYAASYAFWKALTAKQAQEIDEAFDEPGVVKECTVVALRFVEELAPRMRDIKRAAMGIAMDEGGTAELDYLLGYYQGTGIMRKIFERMKPSRNKRQTELKARHCVFLFAVLCGAEIEETKSEANWPELHRQFEEAFDYKVEISEDAFKKILSRKGLKAGRLAGRVIIVDGREG